MVTLLGQCKQYEENECDAARSAKPEKRLTTASSIRALAERDESPEARGSCFCVRLSLSCRLKHPIEVI